MGRLALTHRGRVVDGLRPSLADLEPLIERTPNHWYWLGEFHDDNLDRSAEFRWGPEGEHKAAFMVPRLLWQLCNPDDQSKRLLLENACGLFTCINPAHWRRRESAFRIPARIVLPDSVEAVPVAHHAEVVIVHVRRIDSLITLCGHGPNHKALAKTAPVTCDECIGIWVRSAQPYMEVT